MKKELPSWAYKVAIVVATIIWGYSFVSMKGVVAGSDSCSQASC